MPSEAESPQLSRRSSRSCRPAVSCRVSPFSICPFGKPPAQPQIVPQATPGDLLSRSKKRAAMPDGFRLLLQGIAAQCSAEVQNRTEFRLSERR